MGHEVSGGSEGVLPRQDIIAMAGKRHIRSPFAILDRQYQPASLDLRLGEKVHRVQCSFLPGQETVEKKLSSYTIHSRRLTEDEGLVLEPGAVYIIPLMEALALPRGTRGRANPRSTTGRLDLFTRVITDHGERFDEIPEGYQGPLYLEVLSRSFPVRVVRGLALCQVRFIRGVCRCTDSEVLSLYAGDGPLLYEGDEPIGVGEVMLREGLFLRVDLGGIARTNWVGYKARRNSGLIDLARLNCYQILDFWEPVFRDRNGRVILERGEFYLLTSKEKVRIPPSHAAEMVAYEQTSGELRTHYAGFFDPGFGYGPGGEVKGTVAVLEVRALDAPFMVEDGQRFCRLQLEKMAGTPDVVYGAREVRSSYQFQGLTPSKHFVAPRMEEIKKRREVEQLLLLP
jgi:dCTP deaminase